jgi:hypothetical protein
MSKFAIARSFMDMPDAAPPPPVPAREAALVDVEVGDPRAPAESSGQRASVSAVVAALLECLRPTKA